MTTTVMPLIRQLRENGVRISRDVDNLRIQGARDRLTPELVEAIRAQKQQLLDFLAAADGAGTLAIPRRSGTGPVPLSFIQRNLWLIDQLEGSVHYNMAVALKVEGAVRPKVLEMALRTVVERHEALRTIFRVGAEGQPVQEVQELVAFHMPIHDLRGQPPEAIDDACRRLITEEARRPFDLGKDLMMRAELILRSNDSAVLLITQHHIASDGWSMDVLLEELCTLYVAYAEGRPNPLPSLPVQYGDYAQWLAEWLKGDVLEAKLAYWERRLSGLSPLHNLPLDKPRPPVRTNAGARVTWRCPALFRDRLIDICRTQEVTLFVLLQSVFALFISRWSGERDVAIGTPISSRTHPELTGLIGYFTNTIVLRSDCDGQQSFLEFLRASKLSMLDAHEHHHVPFEMLVERINPPRSLAYNALVQISFAVQDNRAASAGTIRLAGLEISSLVDEDGEPSKFDLELTVKESPSELQFKWNYNPDLFNAVTIERMAQHFGHMLDGILTDPGIRLGDIDLMPAKEVARLNAWNDTAVSFPADDTLVSMVEAQVATTPDACAIRFHDAQWTYRELNSAANRLARHLVERHGIGPGSIVGLCVERSLHMMAGILGILKAGGAYLPLDPSLPDDRLAYMVADSRITVALADSGVSDRLPGLPTLIVEQLGPDLWTAGSDADLPRRAGPHDVAYVLYTSGSTGRPKGTLNRHIGVCNRMHAMQHHFGIGSDDRVLQKTPLSFDVSVWELFWPLTVGATLVVARPDGHRDPDYLASLMAAERITTVHFVPSMLAAFLPAAQARGLPDLRTLITSGEALSFDLQARAIAVLPGARKINQYGPTEAAIDVTAWSFNELRGDRIVPIGRPAANVRIYILDPQGRQVPVGVAGELHIAGVQVGAGYLNNPDLTAEKFVTLTIDGREERLYRTGDRARWLDDGEIDYIGRLDNQVKLRGFRIELGEIEASLTDLPEVEQAAVILSGAIGDPALVGYVVPAAGHTIDTAALKASLRCRLPEHMVPMHLITIDAVPLTASGKLDRRALPAPIIDTGTAAQRPLTTGEEVLANLWAQVLGRYPDGPEAHFFELGGHSLLATQLASLIRRNVSVEVPLRIIFEHPVLKDQAAWLSAQQSGPLLPPIPTGGVGPAPLSYAQLRFWLLAALEGAGVAYTIPRILHLSGPLDVDALARAFAGVVERHEGLRYCFPEEDGTPTVRILPPFRPLAVIDLRHLPSTDLEPTARRLAREQVEKRFELATGPLFSVTLLVRSTEEHTLVLAMHHIISDGWSIGVLMREVATHYAAERSGRRADLPALEIQYSDYARWQREWLSGERLAAKRTYWREKLSGAPALLSLPTDRPRPAVFTYRGGLHRAQLDRNLKDQLVAISRSHGATLFMTVLAAFKVLLARYGDTDDIVVGTPVANRTHHQTEQLIGLFANTLVLRTSVSPGLSFGALLAAVRRTALDAYENGDLPFEQLVEELGPERSLSYGPLFQVMFRLEPAAASSVTLPDLQVSQEVAGGNTAQFDLTLNVIEHTDGLECEWSYAADLFDEETICRLHRSFVTLLTTIIRNEQVALVEQLPVDRLPLRPPAERQDAAVTGDEPDARGTTRTVPVYRLFEEQAARTPEAIAVATEEACLSYAELNRRANQLARRLRREGDVGPGSLVGLCLGRSSIQLIALLAIWKAGGAYVPMDPAGPPSRLAWVAADAGLSVILTRPEDDVGLTGSKVRCLDASMPVDEVDDDLSDGPELSDAAYVLYTSGSTGHPKGVVVEHGNLSAHTDWFNTAWALSPADRVLHRTPHTFDASVWELISPLAVGATIRMVGPGQHADFDAIARALADGVTVMQCVPVLLDALLEAGLLANVPDLRIVFCGGEALSPATTARYWAQCRARLVNLYGPTEVTIDALAWEVTPGADSIPIGLPVAGIRAWLLDRHGEPVPDGMVGELYLSGPQVARGYLNRPELTAERFLDDPFTPGARMYRTGDLARRRTDGLIQFVGRADQQVKINGYRLELGEIEVALTCERDVQEAVVIVREDVPGDRRLVAYVVGSPEATAVARLRPLLAARLPDYMVPSAFVRLEALPLLPNGKVDRRALPPPDVAAISVHGYVPPGNAEEATAAEIWSELLGIGRVGRTDDFFALGGHSLLGLRMVAKLGREFGRSIPLRLLFAHPVLGDFIQATRQQVDGLVTHVPIRSAGRACPLFLVHGGDGEIGYAQRIAAWLPEEVPVHGFSAVGLRPGEVADTSIPDMAARYLADLLRVQPTGPYRIAGWSAGGTIAWEMARQLAGTGQKVDFLGLIDSVHDYCAYPAPLPEAADLCHTLATLLPSSATSDHRTQAAMMATSGDAEGLLDLLRSLGAIPVEFDLPSLAARLDQRRRLTAALRAYAPSPLSVPVTLFLASAEPREEVERAWASLLPPGALALVRIPGDHFSILAEPGIAVLGRELSKALDRSEAGGSPAVVADRRVDQ